MDRIASGIMPCRSGANARGMSNETKGPQTGGVLPVFCMHSETGLLVLTVRISLRKDCGSIVAMREPPLPEPPMMATILLLPLSDA